MHLQSLAVIALLATPALAQTGCPMNVVSQCLSDNGPRFHDSTCMSPAVQNGQKVNNATMYTVCLCYQAVNLGFCYKQCPTNSTLQAEFQSTVQPNITKDCGDAGLDPARLPQIAPWRADATALPSASTSSPARSTAGSSPSSTATTSAQNNGATGSMDAGVLNVIVGAAATVMAGLVALAI
ncbi:hypothetical protein HK104_000506 [Borealophlyctis nickersoniae]|nr:hypothetical protein HK104_000506 [Borealophlyctis nickersoniae]